MAMREILGSIFSIFGSSKTATLPATHPLALTVDGQRPLCDIKPGDRVFGPRWQEDGPIEVHAAPLAPRESAVGSTFELLGMILPGAMRIATPLGDWIAVGDLKVGDEIQGWSKDDGVTVEVILEVAPIKGSDEEDAGVSGIILLGPEGGPYIAGRL